MSTTETDASAEVLTIDEAATILRISRNAAYAVAREWRASGGKTGLPCIARSAAASAFPAPTSIDCSGGPLDGDHR